jgi:hypothetical protein
MVIATQNPVEQEGTYRLPESQLDRFLLRISLGYPGRTAEISILDGHGAAELLSDLQPVVSAEETLTMIQNVRSVYLASALKSYMVDISEASRRHSAIELGLSPRATLQLAAAKLSPPRCSRTDSCSSPVATHGPPPKTQSVNCSTRSRFRSLVDRLSVTMARGNVSASMRVPG